MKGVRPALRSGSDKVKRTDERNIPATNEDIKRLYMKVAFVLTSIIALSNWKFYSYHLKNAKMIFFRLSSFSGKNIQTESVLRMNGLQKKRKHEC